MPPHSPRSADKPHTNEHTMSHYTRHYDGLDNDAADAQAIADMAEYMGPMFQLLVSAAEDPETSFGELRIAMMMVGVSGRPVSAFLRKYRLDEYRAWMHAEPDPTPTDEHGFPLGA